jgi:hypothetical protein
MNHDTGGAAFPCHTNPRPGFLAEAPQGMHLRDYFAAKALQGMLAHPSIAQAYADSARQAYIIADAMLVARQVQP